LEGAHVLSVNTIILDESVGSSPNFAQRCICIVTDQILEKKSLSELPENKKYSFPLFQKKMGLNIDILIKFSTICIDL
jgi:hypothetical protein